MKKLNLKSNSEIPDVINFENQNTIKYKFYDTNKKAFDYKVIDLLKLGDD